MKYFRKPYVSIFLSFTILFFSCTQYDIQSQKIKRVIDYSLFEYLKTNSHQHYIPHNQHNDYNRTTYDDIYINELLSSILDEINLNNNTNLTLQSNLPNLFEMSDSDIYTFAKNQIPDISFSIIDEFLVNLNDNTFEKALTIFEERVENSNFSDREFETYSSFANIISYVNDTYPNIFEISDRSSTSCAIAIAGVILAGLGVILGCATIILCGIAVAGFLISIISMLDACLNSINY